MAKCEAKIQEVDAITGTITSVITHGVERFWFHLTYNVNDGSLKTRHNRGELRLLDDQRFANKFKNSLVEAYDSQFFIVEDMSDLLDEDIVGMKFCFEA